MVRLQVALVLMVVMSAAGFLISLNGCGGVAGNNSQPPPPGKINHVVIIFQDARQLVPRSGLDEPGRGHRQQW
jgi:hypothetical protein